MIILHICVLSLLCLFIVFFFFFQAEDGIRDKLVTGVQTCALPIYRHDAVTCLTGRHPRRAPVGGWPCLGSVLSKLSGPVRSEERRVGKECRSRWSPYH